MASSSRVGLLGTRNLLSGTYITSATVRRIAGAPIGDRRGQLPCVVPSVRWYAAPKVKPIDWTPPSPKLQAAQANANSMAQLSATDVSFILPGPSPFFLGMSSECQTETDSENAAGTLIAPPISQYPREPRKFFKFAYEVFTTWARTTASGLGMVWSSKPSMFKKAQYKLNNAATLLTAKALHRDMAKALAAGDKRTLGKICTKVMGVPMLAAIDARSPKKRYTWELVKYRRGPRIASQIVAPTTSDGSGPLLRQVVVSIASRQRRTEEVRRHRAWEEVPGSIKEVDVTENIVIVSIVHPRTWKQSEWRILGTVPTMTPEDWFAEKEILNKLEQEEYRKKLEADD